MKIVLRKMKIRNFKSFIDREFTPNQDITKVLGQNAAGKSSLQDAFSWCLFGKNAAGKTDFSLKPYDENGVTIPRLETEVETTLEIDGKEIVLTRTQSEKWTKRRGSGTEVFDGNVNKFLFDSVPVKKAEFKKRVETEIISEDVFMLLTNINVFSDMHWTEKREILFEIAGGISDEAVEQSNDNLHGFLTMLNGKNFDDFKKIVASEMKTIKERKNKIPVRLDENDRNLPETPELSKAEIQKQISDYQGAIDEADFSINEIGKSNEKNDNILKEINSLNLKIGQVEFEVKNQAIKNKNQIQSDYDICCQNIKAEERKIVNFENEINGIEASVIEIISKNDALRKKWKELKTETFIEPDRDNFICKCCGQKLPTDDIEKTINDMRVKFAKDLNDQLNKISKDGKAETARKDSLENDVKLINQKIAECNERIEKLEKEKDHLYKVLQIPVAEIDVTKDEKYIDLSNQIKKLESQYEQNQDIGALIEYKNKTIADMNNLKDILKIYDRIDEVAARRQEILDEEQLYSDQLLQLEKKQSMCDEFIKTKVDITDSKINSLFSFCTFKMFDTQVNGEIVDTCEVMVNTNGAWVPFKDANTAGQINAGLDIIKTLSKHYDVIAPIFIDHNESVTSIVEMDAQIIGLYVSDQHKTLTVE